MAAVLKELANVQHNQELTVLFVCDKGFLKQSRGIMETLPFPVAIKTVPSGKLRRYAHFSWWQYIRHFSIILHNGFDIIKTGLGFLKSLWLLMAFRPDVVFAKGGFVCLPVGYAAKLLRIPIVIHDSDVRPGLTNKLMARFASAIGTGMPLENYPYDPAITRYVGVPINPAITPTTDALQAQYRRELDLPKAKKIIVAVGGGLGSQVINNAFIDSAKEMKDNDTVLFCNVTGVNKIDDALRRSEGLTSYQALPFVYKDMHKLLGAADIVVSRASATTLQELAGLQKTVVAVPAKQLGDQKMNAELFSRYDAVIALQDDELNDTLSGVLADLLQDKTRREQLAHNLHAFARPHAARDMATIITKVVGSS